MVLGINHNNLMVACNHDNMDVRLRNFLYDHCISHLGTTVCRRDVLVKSSVKSLHLIERRNVSLPSAELRLCTHSSEMLIMRF